MNKPNVSKGLLWGLGIVLVLSVAAAVTGALLCMVTEMPAYSTTWYGYCQDNLRAIEGAVTMYHIEQGKYPDNLEELVPEYLRVSLPCPENEEGYYFLDTTTSPPHVVCSVNGTLDVFHRPRRKAIDWRYLLMKMSIFIAIADGAAIFLLSKRREGQESIWTEYRIPVTIWFGASLIFVSMLVPVLKADDGFLWFWSSVLPGAILMAVFLFVVFAGLYQFSGEGRKAIIVVGIVALSLLALWSIALLVDMEKETYGTGFSGLTGVGLGLYILASGALVSLLGFIAALREKRKERDKPAPVPAASNPPAATVCARSLRARRRCPPGRPARRRR